MRLHHCLLAVLFPLVAACVSGNPNKESLNARYVVASVPQDNLYIEMIGTTIFQNNRWEIPQPDWNLDRLTSEYAAKQLREAGLKVTKLPRHFFESLRDVEKSTWNGTPQLSEELRIFLRTQTQATSLILVEPTPYSYANNPTAPHGFGVYQRQSYQFKYLAAYISIRFHLINLENGDRVGHTGCQERQERSKNTWQTDSSPMSKANQKDLRHHLQVLWEHCLSEGLYELGLTQDKPPSQPRLWWLD